MVAKKSHPAPINGADVLAVLDRRLRELQQRRLAIIEDIIQAEKSGLTQRDDVAADAATAEALLDGGEFVVSHQGRMSRLAALHAELAAIDAALKVGGSRQHRLAAERAGEVWASYFAEIAEIERRRVFLALDLQATNRRREVLRDRIIKAGGAGFLSTDGVDLLGITHEEVRWAAERLISDGVATHREIEKATSDG